jgi:hypothetical protein
MAKGEVIRLRVDSERKKLYSIAAGGEGMSLSAWILSRLDAPNTKIAVVKSNKVAESFSADVGSVSEKSRRGSPTKNESKMERRDGESDAPTRPKSDANESWRKKHQISYRQFIEKEKREPKDENELALFMKWN